MSRAAVQAQLHALLAAWDASVRSARAELGYDPAWWRPEVLRWTGARSELGAIPTGGVQMILQAIAEEPAARADPLYAAPYWQWMRVHGRALDERAAAALDALALPAIFEPYWRACFLSWQPERGLASVREFVSGRVRRAYPIGEVVSASVRTPARGQPFVEIRAPLRYASRAVLVSAVDSVLPLAGRFSADETPEPLADGRRRRTATARAGRAARNEPLRARTRELAAAGRSTGEIMAALATEFGADRPDGTLDARTVRRWRADIL